MQMSVLFHSLCVSLVLSASVSIAATETPASQVIDLFSEQHIYFGQGINQREVSKTIEFPDKIAAANNQITLNLSLSCPNDLCDFWDRKGSLSIFTDDGEAIELLRFVTPYRVGARWTVDVSDFAPLFVGIREFKVFIDTWVGPGHAQGEGWLVDASLEWSESNRRAPKPYAVLPIWAPQSVEYGNPETLAQLSASFPVDLAKDHTAKLRAFVTGHGQGNSENCAEFCPKYQRFAVNEWFVDIDIWRSDCSETVTDGPQMGTWIYSRSGWCPGDYVRPIEVNLPPDSLTASAKQISWTPEFYINDKRGDYNNGSHTMPYYQVSAALILYEPAPSARDR